MNKPPDPGDEVPGGDPWAAFGYIVAGVAFYGVVGWGLSVWLHAEYWIPIGILFGLALGMVLVFSRYKIGGTEASPPPRTTEDDAARNARPDSDDRGETA
jgi:hypothetical protein